MASISKRQDGKWMGQVNMRGRRKTFYGKTKKEVEKKIQVYMEDLNIYGVELEKTSINVSDWLYKYLFTNMHNKIAHSTFDRYMNLYNSHIKGAPLGSMVISDVKPIHIQEFFNDKREVSAGGLSMTRSILKQSFDFAIVNNLLRVNPVVNIKIPKRSDEKKEIPIFDKDEQSAFIGVLGHTKYKLFFLTALFTGMRLGELIALKWDNVDLESGIITVCESYRRTTIYDDEGNTTREIDKKGTKTKNSNRDIPLPLFLKELLVAHHNQDPEGYVFKTSLGNHMTPENVRRIQISLCEKANIAYKNFHALRHTYATRLIENGVDIKTVSLLLGHADVNITLNTYVHSTDETMVSAVNTLNELYLQSAVNLQ